ncbi:MAG: YbaB/EbfC family nucleoid-associated protein [Segniliparus sp.]|uniref:YbaB/EbfC family nucleoid-associated protein n=1 Tax=Segniliparus sp. TaxID=2804064 RepID=UPI003F2C0F88
MSANIPDPQAVLEQLEEIKRKYLEAQTDVASVRATGFDQDRHVSVTVLGLGEVSDIKIDPSAVNPADVDGLQRKILQAFRSANNQARDLAAQILSPLNIDLPEPEPIATAAEPEPEQPAAPEPALSAPTLSASSLSEAVPSLSPGISLSPALASPTPGLSASVPDLSLPDLSLPDFPATAPEAPSAAAPAEPPAPPAPEAQTAAEAAVPEPEPVAEPELVAAPQRPSLANYQHHRPRW